MMVWKIMFLFNWVMFRFHVNLQEGSQIGNFPQVRVKIKNIFETTNQKSIDFQRHLFGYTNLEDERLEPENTAPPGKGASSSQPSFSGSMLIFGGVSSKKLT